MTRLKKINKIINKNKEIIITLITIINKNQEIDTEAEIKKNHTIKM